MYEYDEKVLQVLRQSLDDALDPNQPIERNAKEFGTGFPGIDLDRLEVGTLSRHHVFGLANDSSINTSTVCAAALAWGGMRSANKQFMLSGNVWLQISERVRCGCLERADAYSEYWNAAQNGTIKGLGPAYFTKLTYFLLPRSELRNPTGYIMDQWTGCSVNLLFRSIVVRMDVMSIWRNGGQRPKARYVVSNANTAIHYEAFCSCMDALTDVCRLSADQLDRALWSKGGPRPATWRKYVIENRRQE